jgi:hypothetical protein
MKLPHLPPLVFAKELIEKNSNSSIVLCEFQNIPQFTTFIEAVAQASSSFVDSKNPMRGFLTTLKNVEQYKVFDKLKYHVHLKLEANVSDLRQFYFEVYDEYADDFPYICGTFTVMIQEV